MKTILYLDQNWISELAKAKFLKDWTTQDVSVWRNLLGLINEKTLADLLICPTSYFHTNESEQGPRVKDIVWKFAEQISFGLLFNDCTQISFNQIEHAIDEFTNVAIDEPRWAIAFNRNPHESIKPLIKQFDIQVHIPQPSDLIEYSWKGHKLVHGIYQTYKVNRRGKAKTFGEELAFQKAQMIVDTFEQPPKLPLTTGDKDFDDVLYYMGSTSILQRQIPITKKIMNLPEPRKFLGSKTFLDCQFIHIRAALMATDIFYFPEKEVDESLNTDFNIVSAVLPYVDLLATDNYVKQLCEKSGLVTQFKARVFSAKSKDRLELLNVLQGLI